MATMLSRHPLVPRHAEQPQCKACGHPLAPWQQQTGVCTPCQSALSGVSASPDHGPDYFEQMCQPDGWRG